MYSKKPITQQTDFVEYLFPEQSPRRILFLWVILCGFLYSTYTCLNVSTKAALLSFFSLLIIGYLIWVLLFTIDGQFFYDRYLSYYLEIASYPKKFRIFFITITSAIGIIIGIFLCIYYYDILSWEIQLFYMGLGIVLGLLGFCRIPNYSLSRHRKNITLAFNLFRVSLPVLIFPISLNSINIVIWASVITGYSFSYLLSEILILFRHYSIDYSLSEIILPDSLAEGYSNEKIVNELKILPTFKGSEKSIPIDVFCGIRTKRFNDVAKKIISDLAFKNNIKDILSLNPELLRDKFRIWYTERNYHKIVKCGDAYIKEFAKPENIQNLSYVITSIYFKSLIRLGDNDITKKKLFQNYGKNFSLIFIGLERANWLWNIGKTKEAVSETRALLNEQPNFTIAKNCLAYYLCELTSRYIFRAKFNTQAYNHNRLFDVANNHLNEAEKLLDEIAGNSKLTYVDSYYWSNLGVLKMLSQKFDEAFDHYYTSINLIRSKENVRSHYGLGLIYLSVYNNFDEANYHFKRTILDVGKNQSSRYFITSNAIIDIIRLLLIEKRTPTKDFIFCTNTIYNYFNTKKTKLTIGRLLDLIPDEIIPKRVNI